MSIHSPVAVRKSDCPARTRGHSGLFFDHPLRSFDAHFTDPAENTAAAGFVSIRDRVILPRQRRPCQNIAGTVHVLFSCAQATWPPGSDRRLFVVLPSDGSSGVPLLSFADVRRPERDVVVTGIGLVTPLATSRDMSWHRLLAGDRASRELSAAEIDRYFLLRRMPGLQIVGAPVDHARVRQLLSTVPELLSIDSGIRSAWLNEPVVAMTLLALSEAAADAGLALPLSDDNAVGCWIGASKGGLRTAELLSADLRGTHRGTLCRLSDSVSSGDPWWQAFQVDAATRAAAAVAGVRQMMSCPVAACATGLVSVLQAAMAISSGQCDICLAGSADAALRSSVLASFHRLRVTSRSPIAEEACRPFDVSRDGFVVGEGAGVLILESRQHADRRNARIYARVTAGGWLSDPTGMTQIDTSGAVVHELLLRTFAAAGLRTSDSATPTSQRASDHPPVDYVSVHGTGTVSNDLAEARGLHRAFPMARPLCSGVKGVIGHLLGGAGSVETALTLLALRDGRLPATTNLRQPDPLCEISLIQGSSQRRAIRRALKLSLGFGGHVACGLFDRDTSTDGQTMHGHDDECGQ